MKKLLFPLQILACCGLGAQDVAATQGPQKTQSGAKCNISPFQQGDDVLDSAPMQGALVGYNRPATIHLNADWEVYADVSFLYWYVGEDGLDLAATGRIAADFWQPSSKNGSLIFQDADYTSAFRVGLGTNWYLDDWALDLEYTFLRQTTNTSSGTVPTDPLGDSAFNLSQWFSPVYYGAGTTATQFSSEWKFALDWCDLTLERPYYQGSRLTVTPKGGLRASWIRQQLKVYTPLLENIEGGGSVTDATASTYSHSWGIGPRAALDAHWLLGMGFRLQGSAGANLLFTQYSVSHREPELSGFGIVKVALDHYNCLRPIAEANLGLGWGGYFQRQQYHFDFSAIYDFNYLWSQNMMRYLVGLNSSMGSSSAAGDLVLHGLELKARLDF